jgi:hypothetical protein
MGLEKMLQWSQRHELNDKMNRRCSATGEQAKSAMDVYQLHETVAATFGCCAGSKSDNTSARRFPHTDISIRIAFEDSFSHSTDVRLSATVRRKC